jgi:hypothetical protein
LAQRGSVKVVAITFSLLTSRFLLACLSDRLAHLESRSQPPAFKNLGRGVF